MTFATAHLRALRVAFAAALVCCFAPVHAGDLAFGKRTIYVPDPDGYIPLAQSMPRYMQAAQAYLPATNRLVEAYATPADAAAMEQGKPVLSRYFQVQVLRSLDGTPVSPDELADAEGEMDRGLKQALGNVDSIGRDLASKGNSEIKRMTAVDPQISVSDTGYLGVYRKEPWGQFFTIKTRLSTGLMSKPTDLVCAGAIVLANYQLVFLYGYSVYKNEGDRQWAEQAVSEWADQVHGANPDDAKVAATLRRTHFDFKEVLRWAVMGGIIGGLVALVGKIVRKRDA
ncbi:MAG TPA: hypothetical protein VFB32_11385 [Rudaea sp.]|nr:hypothetical protein [Rudaea sp.]